MKLDKQSRLLIPVGLMNQIGMKPNVHCFLQFAGDHLVLLEVNNTNSKDFEIHDIVSIDAKGRFILKSHILKYIANDMNSLADYNFIISVFNNKIIVRWYR